MSDENDGIARTLDLTITNSLASNARRVFAITSFKELDASFTVTSTVHTQNTQIAYMYTKLFNCPAPDDHDQNPANIYEMELYLKVSHAAIKTRRPFWISQKQTFDRFVLFPTPLTPTNVML